MNTTGIQNYLSNVFRPIVSYDTVSSNFVPKLELSNIDTYSGNVVSVLRADVGDSNFNVYVGSNAGNSITNLNSCSNVSAFGYAAGNGISNDLNSVYVGYRAGANNIATRSIIGIGSGAGGGSIGLSNIFIGTNTTNPTGVRNILIGHDLSTDLADHIMIGYRNQIPIAADIQQNWVGLGGVLSQTNTSIQLDVSGGTRSTGGYCSIHSNIAVAGGAPIGKIKRGIILVSAVDQVTPTNYASYIYFAWSSSNTVTLASSNNPVDVDIVTSGSDINIVCSGNLTFDYNITYFPLP